MTGDDEKAIMVVNGETLTTFSRGKADWFHVFFINDLISTARQTDEPIRWQVLRRVRARGETSPSTQDSAGT